VRKFFNQNCLGQEISECAASIFLAATLAVLAGCGSGSSIPKDTSSATTTGTAGATTGTTGTTGATVSASTPLFALALTNSAGETVTSISNSAPATLSATLKIGGGTAIANTVVTFSTDPTLVTIAPGATAVTNAFGVATVKLSPTTASTAGTATVKVTAQVGLTAVTDSIGFTVGTAVVTVTAPVLGVTTLSAFGTTSIDVTVSVGGAPVTAPQNVTFSSICANLGTAVLGTGVVTGAGGVARGSYRDNGCATTDAITATAAGVTSAPANLVVTPPTTGSIQFVSATPANISLKGIGGTETSLVSFKVLDASGKPLSGQKVTLSLSTSVGGITLTPAAPATLVSDANGLVVITVNSGTVSTPVRVTASITDASVVPNITLTTQSSGLTITTGIPDQDSFSLSATTLNPEFRDFDGNTTVVIARLADHFNNPVPDGTVVNFTTSGGSIVASCVTAGGACSSTLTSQAPRPGNGRVTVLAYAVGEESFIDLNGNGVTDLPNLNLAPNAPPNEMSDINGRSTDMPEAWRDDNENGVLDANETFIDFNQNGSYDGADGKYSGVLCDSAKSSAGTCSTTKSIHVRKNIVLLFSGSTAVISKIAPAGSINLVGGCSGTSVQVDLRVVDAVGNPMPAGTTINVKASDGTISGNSSFTEPNANVTPAAGVANYSVSVRDDGSQTSTLNPVTGETTVTCTDTTLSGVLTVTVTTPGGTITTAQFNVIN